MNNHWDLKTMWTPWLFMEEIDREITYMGLQETDIPLFRSLSLSEQIKLICHSVMIQSEAKTLRNAQVTPQI